MPFSSSVLWYNESAGNNVNSSQASGAYIFRPNVTTPYRVSSSPPMLTVVKGDIVTTVYQVWADWATATYKLINGTTQLSACIRICWSECALMLGGAKVSLLWK